LCAKKEGEEKKRMLKRIEEKQGGKIKVNIKMGKNAGITLIALVVTIIVLIILSTVSINVVFSENGIIKKAELAKNIQANSTKMEEETMNILLEEYTNIMETKPINPEEDKEENIKPVIVKEGYCKEEYTDYIKVSAMAEDTNEGDELTYILSWGETEEYGETYELKGVSGEEVTFERDGLKNYTTYYWKVDVTDGIEKVEGTPGKTKTYCPTTQCKGPFTERINCDICNRSRKYFSS